MSSHLVPRFGSYAVLLAAAALFLAACGTPAAPEADPPEPESFAITSLEGTIPGYAAGPAALLDAGSDGLAAAGTVDAGGNVRIALAAEPGSNWGFTGTLASLAEDLDPTCETSVTNPSTVIDALYVFTARQADVDVGLVYPGDFDGVNSLVEGSSLNGAFHAAGPGSFRTTGACGLTGEPVTAVIDLELEAGWNAVNISLSGGVLRYTMGFDDDLAWQFEAATP